MNTPLITGVGIIAPNGIGKDAYWSALKQGISGIRPVSVFETAFFRCKSAGEVAGFEAETFLGPKGLRTLDRGTKFLCSAARLCLDDSRLQINEENSKNIGMVTATTLSVIMNISEFTKEAETEGANPAMFPGTTINAPSSQASIRLSIKGFNATVSTGYTASLDSLKYALDFLKQGRVQAVLVAGVEFLFFQSFVGFHKLEFLAGMKGEELCCPFDKRRNGIMLGEGAAAVLLETEEHAKQRNAPVYGRVLSSETLFDPYRSGKYSPHAEGLKRTMSGALRKAGVKPGGVDYISCAANSVVFQDALECEAIHSVFGDCAKKIPSSSIKSMLGESVSAAGCFQLAAAAGTLVQDFIPPTINYKEKDPACDIDCVPNTARKKKINTILINNFGPGGTNASAVVCRY